MNAIVLFEDRHAAHPATLKKEEAGPRSPAFAGAGTSGVTGEGEYEPGHTPVFSPQSQAKFLDNLSINGNVRHACKVARVSPQTAYRARRKSAAFAQLWDAALLSARNHAEEALASRALDGVEESVFYHGEEVATRIRYDSRLLLAHLARLDRLAERAEVSAALHEFDDAVEALGRGEDIETSPDFHALRKRSCDEVTQAQHERGEGGENCSQDSVPSVPSCREPTPAMPSCSEAVGRERRLAAMDAARPRHALTPDQIETGGMPLAELEALQLAAFEGGVPDWWLIISHEQLNGELDKLGALVAKSAARSGRRHDAR